MKQFTLRLCALFALACLFSPARAQSKTGYIDLQQLVSAMPESSVASARIESLRQSLNSEIAALNSQLEAKISVIQNDQSAADDPARASREAEVKALGKQLQEAQASAQQSVINKTNELTAQILDKAKLAISQVAEEGNYSLVLRVSQGDVLYSGQQVNILPAVKSKLGIQ